LVAGAKVLVTEEATALDGSGGGDPDIVRVNDGSLKSWQDQEGGSR
jgi:hypothetical protein